MMRQIRNYYVQYFYEECGAYELDWEGYEILEKIGDDYKVVGCIPAGAIGNQERFETMDEKELERLVDYFIAYCKMMQSIDSMSDEDLPF